MPEETKVVPIDAAREGEASEPETREDAPEPEAAPAPPSGGRSWLLPGLLAVVAAVLAFFLFQTHGQRVALEGQVQALQGELTAAQGEIDRAHAHLAAVGEQVTTLSQDVAARLQELQGFVASGLPGAEAAASEAEPAAQDPATAP